TEVLQRNIQRGPQGGQRRKETKRGVLPLVIDRQKGWGNAIQIEHPPTAWHVRIAEEMFEETPQAFVGGIVCSFAMNPSDDARGRHVPVFDERSQAVWIEYKSRSVVRRPGIAAREEGKNAPGASIHPQRVPTAIQNQYRIGLKLRHEKFHSAAR